MKEPNSSDDLLVLLREIRAQSGLPPKVWLTPEEAAGYLGTSRATIYKWVGAGSIPFHRIPGSSLIRFKIADLDEWIHNGGDRSNTAVDDVIRKLRG